MGWRIVRQSVRLSVRPQILATSSPKLHTRFWWNLTTTFTIQYVPKFGHGIKKKNRAPGGLRGVTPKIGICFLSETIQAIPMKLYKNTQEVPKVVHSIKKIGVWGGRWREFKGDCPPKEVYAFLSKTTQTIPMKPDYNLHHPWCTKDCSWHWKKNNPEVFTFFLVRYFVDHPCRLVYSLLSYPAVTRWAPRGIAPLFIIYIDAYYYHKIFSNINRHNHNKDK